MYKIGCIIHSFIHSIKQSPSVIRNLCTNDCRCMLVGCLYLKDDDDDEPIVDTIIVPMECRANSALVVCSDVVGG